jgi:hypothetical protein
VAAYILRKKKTIRQEPLPPEQNAVLRVLFFLAHQEVDFEKVVVLDFSKTVNQLLERAGERARSSARKVGSLLTSLGFTNRCRRSRGCAIQLTRSDLERVHQLSHAHYPQVQKIGSWSLQ